MLGPLLFLGQHYTRTGLSLKAVGESIDVAFAAGRNPRVIQIAAIAAGGALSGLGGAQLSLGLTHTWSEGMTVGRGFVAVGLVIFAMWSPLRRWWAHSCLVAPSAFNYSFKLWERRYRHSSWICSRT